MRAELAIPLTLQAIICCCSGTNNGCKGDKLIFAICNDSRELCPGDLYVAIKGEKFDGNNFCNYANSIGCLVLSENNFYPSVFVKSTRDALLNIAKHYKSLLPSLKYTVGITGSCGKTTTKEFLKLLCSTTFKVHSNAGNFNNEIGLAFTILTSPKDTELLIAELGTNSPGEINRLSECLKADIGIITNIGTSHIGAFGTRKNIAREKADISKRCKITLCDYGEPLLCDIKNRVTVSATNPNSYYYVNANYVTQTESNIEYRKDGKKVFSTISKINAPHLIQNLAFSISAASILGVTDEKIMLQTQKVNNSQMRHKIIEFPNFKVLDDSYNASYESVKAALEQLKLYSGKRSALLGDILELGKESEYIHFKIGEAAYRSGIRNLYLYGEFAEIIKKGALTSGMNESQIFINQSYPNINETVSQILENTVYGETILFKASHKLNLDVIIKRLKEIT